MSIQQRAVVFIDEQRNHATVRQLREALAKIGLSQALCTQNTVEIANVVYSAQLPIIFVDHDKDSADGLFQFEKVFRSPGNQLLQFVMILPTDEVVVSRRYESLGLAGVIRKPVQNLQVADVIKPLIMKRDDMRLKHAHAFALSSLKRDFEAAEKALVSLKHEPLFKNKIDLARIHLNSAQGLGIKVMTIFEKLMRAQKVELHVLSEYAFFLKKFSIYEECQAVFAKIRAQLPGWKGKTWEEIIFLGELEKLDEIAMLLESNIEDEDGNAMLSRLMYCMGLERKIGEFLNAKSISSAAFEELMVREQQRQQGKPSASTP